MREGWDERRGATEEAGAVAAEQKQPATDCVRLRGAAIEQRT